LKQPQDLHRLVQGAAMINTIHGQQEAAGDGYRVCRVEIQAPLMAIHILCVAAIVYSEEENATVADKQDSAQKHHAPAPTAATCGAHSDTRSGLPQQGFASLIHGRSHHSKTHVG
jgi:hypothetical protein